MSEIEFGLGAYEIAFIVLMHENRLRHDRVLWIDAAGDEYSNNERVRSFCCAPLLYIFSSELTLGEFDVDHPDGRHGSASAFLVRGARGVK